MYFVNLQRLLEVAPLVSCASTTTTIHIVTIITVIIVIFDIAVVDVMIMMMTEIVLINNTFWGVVECSAFVAQFNHELNSFAITPV